MIQVAAAVTLLVFAGASHARAQTPTTSVRIPHGQRIAVDGVVDDAEWRGALRVEHPTGTVVRLMRDADYVYIGITSERQGYASLCVAREDDVSVLHASAALGAVRYRRIGDDWQSPDTAFRYLMRNTALDAAARAERATYLNENGWVASTVRMGNDGRSQEMQISLRRFPMPFSIALARYLFSESVELWPATITDHDGCFSSQLVRGAVPQGLQFKTSFWLTVENR